MKKIRRTMTSAEIADSEKWLQKTLDLLSIETDSAKRIRFEDHAARLKNDIDTKSIEVVRV